MRVARVNVAGAAGPVRSVGGLSQGTARLRSASPFTPMRSAGPVRSVGGLSQGTACVPHVASDSIEVREPKDAKTKTNLAMPAIRARRR